MNFIEQMVGSTLIEYVAVTCGLLNVYFIIKRSIWNYLFGFVMVILYAKIFYDYRLYSDSLLQVFFFFTQVYGFFYWVNHKAPDGKVLIADLGKKSFVLGMLSTTVLWLLISVLMRLYTDATHPNWDSAIAALSVTAQILLMRRHIESWYLWIMVDLLAIGLFIVKDLTPTAVLYAVFLILAIIGLLQWRVAPRD
ncbi:nicotinamide riboside transporter PnuC [Microbulbifer thermotolerans]|uniref:Nicotinamide riboside transporter PnuC n=1 Tax=Microbulbifer thermotolerans TaxID=252514 RepID=A0AB35I0A3_MICTH|nr:nicotinamide riboside transporter PnuC [Microbulbifer thermotolerans]MCX2779301.1 nicotinamide riboside transporter PnuC [Microbulbifer thermotolerans]MCX2803188.1 nicotinamide riboside transporter PnuC [Microbulbifer thermotolerans]MCX2806537.1 nicotinamide riboside transporter PnuC [Microbulbifer thermotolerans]MCX2840003.1 nicotinamide riboside transporter PnuC [Microbulbifer thermotolerans]SFB81340.1 nicotinamide mononucleotide transporter [Microbulbifer thermotolerans]